MAGDFDESESTAANASVAALALTVDQNRTDLRALERQVDNLVLSIRKEQREFTEDIEQRFRDFRADLDRLIETVNRSKTE